MALDHVRDYFHVSGWLTDPLDPKTTTTILFLTRWITHFCAPVFVFLSGASAWLQRVKGKETAVLSQHLFTRGLWLVVMEFTVLSFGWSFSIPLFPNLQTIWAIGCSMIGLSALVWLPRRAVLGIGIAIVGLHNFTDSLHAAGLGRWGVLWTILHEGGPLVWHGTPMVWFFYPLLPWLGVMALGYGMGWIFLSPNRDRLAMTIGAVMIALFLVIRYTNAFGDPKPWMYVDGGRTWMKFLDVQKYPPSLLYVLMTLGPTLLLVPIYERLRGVVADTLRTFGSVPFIAYVAHIYVLHALVIVFNLATGKPVGIYFNTIYKSFFAAEQFRGLGYPLPVVYFAWALVIALIYPLCRYWESVKKRKRTWWLSYLQD